MPPKTNNPRFANKNPAQQQLTEWRNDLKTCYKRYGTPEVQAIIDSLD